MSSLGTGNTSRMLSYLGYDLPNFSDRRNNCIEHLNHLSNVLWSGSYSVSISNEGARESYACIKDFIESEQINQIFWLINNFTDLLRQCVFGSVSSLHLHKSNATCVPGSLGQNPPWTNKKIGCKTAE